MTFTILLTTTVHQELITCLECNSATMYSILELSATFRMIRMHPLTTRVC